MPSLWQPRVGEHHVDLLGGQPCRNCDSSIAGHRHPTIRPWQDIKRKRSDHIVTLEEYASAPAVDRHP
jgi:hypothetical protein